MKRFAFEQLKSWKESPNRKPLVIRGARQVGKTWLMKEFGEKEYRNSVYLNFDENPGYARLFEDSLQPQKIVSLIELLTEQKIDEGETLVIFDEVQEAPRALSALKYFCEQAPGYHIMCAGSLLGIALHRGTSFPVGKVDFLQLVPLSFNEFLLAMEKGKLVSVLDVAFAGGRGFESAALRVGSSSDGLGGIASSAGASFDGLESATPFAGGDSPDSAGLSAVMLFKSELVEALRQYYVVGGMPEVVAGFAQDGSFQQARAIQSRILQAYEQDFSKHAPAAQVPKIRAVFNSVVAQLLKENKKFVYGLLRQGARAKEYETAIMWLCDCGILRRVGRVAALRKPLKAYEDPKAFKLYFLDIGLLSGLCGLDERAVFGRDAMFSEFKGALSEQFVCQQIGARTGLAPCYYSNGKSTCEVDFVIDRDGEVVPVEVKAETNLKAKSLKSVHEKFGISHALRVSMSDYREEDWIVNVPLYVLESWLS